MADYSMTSKDFALGIREIPWTIKGSFYSAVFPQNLLYNQGNGIFSSDCNNLIKAFLWAQGKLPKYKGEYYYNPGKFGLGDLTCEQMIAACTDVTTDFTKLASDPELLFIPKEWTGNYPHVGAYVGDFTRAVSGINYTWNTIESSPSWNGGIQCTYVDSKGGRYRCKGGEKSSVSWQKHGKMTKWIEYPAATPVVTDKPLTYKVTYSGNKIILDVDGKGQIVITNTIK